MNAGRSTQGDRDHAIEGISCPENTLPELTERDECQILKLTRFSSYNHDLQDVRVQSRRLSAVG